MTYVSLLMTALMGTCIAYDAYGQVTVIGEKGSQTVTTDEIRKYARGGSATEQFKQYIKDGEIKGNKIISQVDDSTQIFFRDDTGEFAHAIRLHGYINPVNHYNIEIQTKSISGKWKSVWSFHIIMDDEKNIVDAFD